MRRRWRPALWRMARRELRRNLGRSGLVVALVALPVAGLAAGVVLLRAAAVSGEQRAAARLGAATLRVDAAPGARLDPAALPRGSRTVSFAATEGLARVGPGDARPVSLTDQPLDDPLTAGMLRCGPAGHRCGRARPRSAPGCWPTPGGGSATPCGWPGRPGPCASPARS